MAFLFLLIGSILGLQACSKEGQLAHRIEQNTPTELPVISTEGLSTMGAIIHTDTGRVLFVASGVSRPEIAMAESVSCSAFNNILKQSSGAIAVGGIYCRRPEIGDDRRMFLGFNYITTDSVQISFSYYENRYARATNYTTRDFSGSEIEYEILRDDRENLILSGTFSGSLLNRKAPFDTLVIKEGRFDVTYGYTP